MAIPYEVPNRWIRYDALAIAACLAGAKAAVISLTTIPYQRSWAEQLQEFQLKREIAGTSRIEGADFTDKELEAALRRDPGELLTRSQRQAASAVKAYRWIARLPADRPITDALVREIHGLIVRGADDDHCPPGVLRSADENVVFGQPRHRGAEGGGECAAAFEGLCDALRDEYPAHDHLVQALAFHYHLAAMHPFLDGNGRTARAVEALMLQRAGLRETLFIAMSNYYYEEKDAYLRTLAEVRQRKGDLTPFLEFGLRGIEIQCQRLFREIREQISRVLFKSTMYDLFHRLQSPRKRVIATRQLEILKLLLDRPRSWSEVMAATREHYRRLRNPIKALARDVNHLVTLRAIDYRRREDGSIEFSVRLEWPTEITESEFFRRVRELPKAKTHSFL